jgi:KAP family P-loop domain
MSSTDRIVRVVGNAGEQQAMGTGFLLNERLLLTAAHFSRGESAQLQVSVGRRVLQAAERWRDSTLDLAIYELGDTGALESLKLDPIQFGSSIGNQPVAVDILGYLSTANYNSAIYGGSDLEQVSGRLLPLSGRKSREVVIEISSVPPVESAAPWVGMIGAPVLHQEMVLGIVTESDRPSRLRGPAIAELLERREVARLLQKAGLHPVVEPVELKRALFFPTNIRQPTKPSELLDPLLAVVPFMGRQAELSRLHDWCLSSSEAQVLHLAAPAGFGKTRLAIELMRRLSGEGVVAGFLRAGADLSALAQRFNARVLIIADVEFVSVDEVESLLRFVSTVPSDLKVLVMKRQLLADRETPRTLTMELAPLNSFQDRELHYVRAFESFVRALPHDGAVRQPLAEPSPDLRAPEYASVLRVHMAALASALGHSSGELPSEDEVVTDSAGVGTRGFGDRPARRDLLRREAMIEALADLLVNPGAVSSSTSENWATSIDDHSGPTVVALDGPWGSGKTTIMDLVSKRIARGRTKSEEGSPRTGSVDIHHPPKRLRVWQADFALGASTRQDTVWKPEMARVKRSAANPPVLTVQFEPWSHQTGEQVWAGFANALIDTSQKIFGWHRNARERYWFARNMPRLDAREMQRVLRKRITSPLLRVAVFALAVPIVAQLARAVDTTYTFGNFGIVGVNLAWIIPACLLLLGLLHTVANYFCRAAASVLPVELFTRPVLTSALAPGLARNSDTSLEDPYYSARFGYLYLAQHDVFRVLRDLESVDRQVIVFVDDLDRCSPSATAQVFEAINVFLTKTFPTTRFVIGLDSVAVVAHLDDSYKLLSTQKSIRTEADLTAGWGFFRKLVQLHIVMPPMTRNQVAPVLHELLGEVALPVDSTEPADAALSGRSDATTDLAVTDALPAPVETTSSSLEESEPMEPVSIVPTLERNAEVRKRLVERLEDSSALSGRETKRLLTTWQYYVRVAEGLNSLSGPEAVRRAKDLVILAEIVARWPAAQRALHGRYDGKHGLSMLATSANNDTAWARATRKIGLGGEAFEGCRDGVRVLLQRYDGAAVSELARQLM